MGMAGWRHPAPIPRRRLRRLGLEAFGACWFPRFIFRSRAPGKPSGDTCQVQLAIWLFW